MPTLHRHIGTPFCTYIQDWDSESHFLSLFNPMMISCVPLSDKATNQISHNFPSVILVLGATALRMGKKPCGHTPTDTMFILLPEVMKSPGGWHEGCKNHCTVAPSSSMLLLLLRCHSPLICHRHRQHCQICCWSHRESSNICIYNPEIAIHAHF